MSIGTRVDIERKFFAIVRKREQLHEQACAARALIDSYYDRGIQSGAAWDEANKREAKLDAQIRELDEQTYQMALSVGNGSSKIFRYEFERLLELKRRQLCIVKDCEQRLAERENDFNRRSVEKFTTRAENTERMIQRLLESSFLPT